MAAQLSEEMILGEIGDVVALDRELRRFRKAAKVLSRKHPRLMEAYPKQWIGVYHGRVAVRGRTLQSVLTQLDQKSLPREQVIVRFIDKNERTMIL